MILEPLRIIAKPETEITLSYSSYEDTGDKNVVESGHLLERNLEQHLGEVAHGHIVRQTDIVGQLLEGTVYDPGTHELDQRPAEAEAGSARCEPESHLALLGEKKAVEDLQRVGDGDLAEVPGLGGGESGHRLHQLLHVKVVVIVDVAEPIGGGAREEGGKFSLHFAAKRCTTMITGATGVDQMTGGQSPFQLLILGVSKEIGIGLSVSVPSVEDRRQAGVVKDTRRFHGDKYIVLTHAFNWGTADMGSQQREC